MFQQPPDNGAHADVFRQPRHLRAQGAHPAHNQINLHARCAGGIQRLYHLRLNQRIELGDDARGFAVFCVFGFADDAVHNHFVQRKRALVDFFQLVRLPQARDFHK